MSYISAIFFCVALIAFHIWGVRKGMTEGYWLRKFWRKKVKPKIGEAEVALILTEGLDSKQYTVLQDIMLLNHNGDTTQIDQVVVSRWGIFVIETKTMRGWIFGEATDESWTQSLNHWRKPKFLNPIRQNAGHVRTLSERLDLPCDCFHSIVAFAPEAEFKKKFPSEVMHFQDVVKYIQEHSQTEVLLPEQVTELVRQIQAMDAAVSPEQRAQHSEKCQERAKARKQKHQPRATASNSISGDMAPNGPEEATSARQATKSASVLQIGGELGKRLSNDLDGRYFRVMVSPYDLPALESKSQTYLVLSHSGIFVVRHIPRGGVIYGNVEAHIWNSQYNVKYLFSNPLEQNAMLVAKWSREWQLPGQCFHSIVAFNDSAQFKNSFPPEVMKFSEVSGYILQNSQSVVLTDA